MGCKLALLKNRMKVAYVIPSLQKPSGWRTHSAAFINAMQNYLEPVVLVSKADFMNAKILFSEQRIISIPVTQQASLSNRRGLRDLIVCFGSVLRTRFPAVDIVHSLEGYPTGLVGDWLARKMGRPHVLTTHGTYGVVWYERLLDRMAYQRVLQRAGLVCPVSEGTARLMRQYFSKALAHTRVQPILNGNDFYKSVPQSDAVNRPFPLIPTILSVGEVKPRKGYHVSLEVFARVKAQLPAACYLVVGKTTQNSYFAQLQGIIAGHQLQDVTFLGAVSDEDLRRYYQQATVFVLTPQQIGSSKLHFEGFGLVYLEAGAYGLPVVATRSGGVPEAVKDGVTGFLAEPEDIESLADALVRLLTDPDLNRRMGRANRLWAETLTWERCAQEQYQAYRSLLAA